MASKDEAKPMNAATQSKPRLAFVAPRFRNGADWMWVSQVPPMSDCSFARIFIERTFDPFPKATKFIQHWHYRNAAKALQDVDLAYFFSPEVTLALNGRLSRRFSLPPRIHVGYHQDGPRPAKYVQAVGHALRQCDAVTTFTNEERLSHIQDYGLDSQRTHVVPIQTDESEGYGAYQGSVPLDKPYVLSMGSPNRRFTEIAQTCHDNDIPLVIVTRPGHSHDSMRELEKLGAHIILDADKIKALTWLKNARLLALDFLDPQWASGFITLIHSMFLNTPIVTSNSKGVREHVINGETGIVVEHRDHDGLAKGIVALWQDSALCDQYGEASHRRAQEEHSLEASSRRFYDIGMKVLAERSASHSKAA